MRTMVLALSISSAFFMQPSLHGMELMHEGLSLFSSGYILKEYAQLFGEFRRDPRPTNWKPFLKHSIYDFRTPARMFPWIPSYGLAFCTLAEIYARHFTKSKFSRKLKRTQKKNPNLYQGSKMLVALPILSFWSHILIGAGTNALRHPTRFLIAPLSLYLAGSHCAPAAQKLFAHVFLHRKKKARPFH